MDFSNFTYITVSNYIPHLSTIGLIQFKDIKRLRVSRHHLHMVSAFTLLGRKSINTCALCILLAFLATTVLKEAECSAHYIQINDVPECIVDNCFVEESQEQETEQTAAEHRARLERSATTAKKNLCGFLICIALAIAITVCLGLALSHHSASKAVSNSTVSTATQLPEVLTTEPPARDLVNIGIRMNFSNNNLLFTPQRMFETQIEPHYQRQDERTFFICYLQGANPAALAPEEASHIAPLNSAEPMLLEEQPNGPDARFHLIQGGVMGHEPTFWKNLISGLFVYPHKTGGDASFPKWIEYTETANGTRIVYPRNENYSLNSTVVNPELLNNFVFTYRPAPNASYAQYQDNKSPFEIRWEELHTISWMHSWPLNYILKSGEPVNSISEKLYFTNIYFCNQNLTSTVEEPIRL